jgi:hypothetical protein
MEAIMHLHISALIAASLLFTPLNVPAKQNAGSNSRSSQSHLSENPSPCEHIRITLNSGRKIDADSYKYHDNQIEITRKGVRRTFGDKEVRAVDVRQGFCRDVVVKVKTGEKIKGYLREQTCDDRGCKSVIKQTNGVLTILNSDIKDLSYRATLGERVRKAAIIPIIPFIYLILAIACRNGCNDL